MRNVTLSIRTILLVMTGALTVMIVALSLRELYDNASRLSSLEVLRSASIVSDELFEASDKLSLERDVSVAMLSADAATIEDLRPRLDASRTGADQAFEIALDSLSRYDFTELGQLRATLATRLAAIRAIRPDIDAALAVPQNRRSHIPAQQFSTDVASLADATEDLWIRFVGHFIGIDPIASLNMRFKHVLRRIRDRDAEERLLIGQALAENARSTPRLIADLLRAQGGAEQNWQSARTLALQSGLYDAIAQPFGDARSHYETVHDMTHELFYVPGARYDSYPISADLWFELSTQSSDTFQELINATVAATQAHLDTLIARARGQIALQALVLLLAALLCAASFWVVLRRVIRPVSEIVDAMVKATHGEHVEIAPSAVRQDEIGKLVDVLLAFRRTMDEVRRTAGELDRSQTRLRAVVDNAVDGLITLDERGVVQTFNPASERIFGYRADEVAGRPAILLMPELYGDGDYADLASYVADAQAQVSGATTHEVRARRKDRTVFPLEISLSAYKVEGISYYSAVVRDVTLRKEAETSLVGYTHALERSNKELDDFAYIASHDLKEPLRGIHNHARFLLEDNADKLDEESAKRLGRLVFLSQRMERLVNDLLYFSRLGRQELAIQPTDIAATVHDIEATLDHFLEERNARIVVVTEIPLAVCDKPRVSELFRNLITNAVKYNDKDQKLVEVGFLPLKVRPNGRRLSNVYYVKDNGRGVDPEFHEEIFRIFKRLQAEGAEDGTGVGLTFVKKIVERHGGEIWLESEVGHGATFFFTLEATRDDRHEAAA